MHIQQKLKKIIFNNNKIIKYKYININLKFL